MGEIDDPGEVCSQCKRVYASVEPRDLRNPELCYTRLQGRSRRAERNCAGATIRRLQDRVRELEAWQTEVRIARTVYNPPPGNALHAAIALADAGRPDPARNEASGETGRDT